MSLESRIEELTAAVKALTLAMSLQPNNPAAAPLDDIKPKAVKEVPNEAKKIAPPITDTSTSSSLESEPVTYADVSKITIAVSKISRDKAVAGLARFGVTSAKTLTEAQWPEYLAYMKQVEAGEVDPEAGNE